MPQYELNIYTPHTKLTFNEKSEVANFLYQHLGEYGDERKDIEHCIDYAMKEVSTQGGFVITLSDQKNIIGSVVVNETGMSGYIPENILVYIAVHKEFRGKGIGKKLMRHALQQAKGDMALHVEPDNPAKFLYENLGFQNKYLEMRYSQSAD